MYNFCRFFFCIDHFRKSRLAKVIDNTLGVRGNLAKYIYSEIFESMMAIYLTGGSRIEDAKRLSAQFSEKSQGYRLCSPDTILKTLSDKTEKDTFVQSGEGNLYKFSINAGLSGLLLDGMLECGQIDEATIQIQTNLIFQRGKENAGAVCEGWQRRILKVQGGLDDSWPKVQ